MKHLKMHIMLATILAFGLPYSIFSITPKKPWTFLVYIAGANNLNEYVPLDIAEMKKVGSNENINVLSYVTVQYEGRAKTTGGYYIEKGRETKVLDSEPMDSGSRDTLLQAMQWAVTEYPSDHLAVVLWNHGSGPVSRYPRWMRGVCYDDQTGNFLTDADCKYVFEKIITEHRDGRKIDIIAFDACLMAHIEIAYSLQSCADYLVASQETIPGYGYDYAGVLTKSQEGTLLPEVFARAMVEEYDKEYAGQNDYTLSLIDLNKLPSLIQATNQLGQLLASHLQKDTTGRLKQIIEKCASSRYCLHFSEQTYIDLYGFYRALLNQLPSMPLSYSDRSTLSNVLIAAQRACTKCILDNVHSSDLRTSRGLSVYFPDKYEGIERSYASILWSRTTTWLNFLNAYLYP